MLNLVSENVAKRKYTIFFASLFCFCIMNAYSQKINVDSLYGVLKKAKTSDQKAIISLELVNYFNRNYPDSCEYFLKIAKTSAENSESKKLKANVLLAEANYLQNTGKFTESEKLNEQAITFYESVHDVAGLANAYSSLGLLLKKNSGDEFEVKEFSKKALAYEQKALGYYLQGTNTEGLLKVYSNMGIINRDLKDFKEAEKQFIKGIETAKKLNYVGVNLGVLKAGYSQIFLDYYKDNKKAISLLDEAIEIYQRNGVRTSLEHAYRNKSFNYTAMGQYNKAIEFGNMAVKIANEVKDPHRQIMAYSSLHHAQKMAGMYKESMINLEHLNDIEHVLLSKEKAAILTEMNTKYETIKKDAAIKVLNKNAEINTIKSRSLIFIILLLAFGSSFVYYSIVQKRKSELKIAEQEKTIEHKKLLNTEQELEFKKKELTVKVLQLARKNEFLGTLENEVGLLKSNVDSSVEKASNRIKRLITHDISDEKQWEQFSKEFSGVHQDFIDTLLAKYGEFSKSEIRLISLLKMNLSSKEIANMLNISDDGIKKARYRLRKKLHLNSESDIHSFLLSFA